MSACPDANLMVAFLEGGALERRDELEAHLDECASCRELLAAVVGTGSISRPAKPEPVDEVPSASPAFVPEHPGRYVLLEECGRGGQSRVWVALDRTLGREVALKELLAPERAAGGEEKSGLRFLREARITASLSHPGIVTIHELGTRVDGTPYYTMELLRGHTLAEALAARRSLAERLELLGHFLNVCHAVAYAHSRGVLHRDIKPHNIMVGAYGETVLLDWGLAKLRGAPDDAGASSGDNAQATDATVNGAAVGTPAYMSPEQAAGHLDEIDELSDVFGLGALLHHLLSGRPPFEGQSTLEVIRHVRSGERTPIAELCPEAPAELQAVAEKALRSTRHERYQAVTELAADVEAYLAGRRVAAYDYNLWESVRKTAALHRRALVTLSVIAAALLVALTTVSFAYRSEGAALRREAEARRQEHAARVAAANNLAEALAGQAERLSREHRVLSAPVFAAASLVENPSHSRDSAVSEAARQRFPEAVYTRARAATEIYLSRFRPVRGLLRSVAVDSPPVKLAVSPDGRALAVVLNSGVVELRDMATLALRGTVTHGSNVALSVAFSAARRQFASVGREAYVRIWDLDRLTPAATLTRPGFAAASGVAFSPDGALLASADRDGTVTLWPVGAPGAARVLRGHRGRVMEVAFSPDGRRLASAGSDRTVRLWDVASGRIIAVLRGHTNWITTVAFSPDGSWLASGGTDRTVRLWHPVTGALLRTIGPLTAGVIVIDVASDGRRLACGLTDGLVSAWDVSGGAELLFAIEAHPGSTILGLTFTRDGRRLASSASDGVVKLWDLHQQHTVFRASLPAEIGFNVAVSPDGRALAVPHVDHLVRLFRLDGSPGHEVLSGHKGEINRVAFSPDGQKLASCSIDGTVRVWELATKRVLHVLEHRSPVYAVAFSPDGRRIATGTDDGTVVVWDAQRGVPEISQNHEGSVNGISFSPDGRWLAFASRTGSVLVWRTDSLSRTTELKGERFIEALEFSHAGNRLLAAGRHRAVIWRVPEWTKVLQIEEPRGDFSSAAFSFDDRFVATATFENRSGLWSADTGEPILAFDFQGMSAVCFLGRGLDLVLAGENEFRVYPLDFAFLASDPTTLLREAEETAGLHLAGFTLRARSSP
jgi:WD40 repeat protein/serine/threonine protein kinase